MTICRSMPYLMIKQTVITNIPPMIPVAIPVPPCYNQYNKRKKNIPLRKQSSAFLASLTNNLEETGEIK